MLLRMLAVTQVVCKFPGVESNHVMLRSRSKHTRAESKLGVSGHAKFSCLPIDRIKAQRNLFNQVWLYGD